MSPTSTVTIRMIYFTTGEGMFTPDDSNVHMSRIQLSGSLISVSTGEACSQESSPSGLGVDIEEFT